jgi:hypothetical protein
MRAYLYILMYVALIGAAVKFAKRYSKLRKVKR